MDALGEVTFNDLEDSLQMQCAYREDLDYILTRNIKDFRDSKIKAISPEDFLLTII